MIKLITSRTIWTVVAMFVVGGLNAVMPVIPAEWVPYIQGFLGLLAMYFKLNPSQSYGKPS